jgi:hypothetical protein
MRVYYSIAKPRELATGGPPRTTKVQLAQHVTTNGGDARPTDKVIARYTRIVVIAASRERKNIVASNPLCVYVYYLS